MEGKPRVTTYRMAAGVLRAELDGDEVVLNPETGIYHLLNPTGRKLVEAFDGGSSLEQAVATIASDAGIDEQRVREDSEVFIRAMVDRGLLEEVQ
jgi:hypothetical protein